MQSMRFFPSIILSVFFTGSFLWSNSSNPPNGYHGESNNCATCHTGNLNTGDGSISISGLPSTYTPGQTYDLALTVLGTNSRGYGFQLIPKANGSTSGSITAVSSGMGIENGAAEHRGTSSSGSWNFQWTAPATDEGTVTFYASGLATGGTSGKDGDFVYTLSQDISAVSFAYASQEWNAATGGVIFSSPAIGADGSVYIGSNDSYLHAFNGNGTSKWTFQADNWIDSTPAIGSDGTIYVGSWDNKVYAIDSDNGNKTWEYETNSYVIASPAIGADGKVYVGSKDSIFYAFESNGSLAWEYFAGQPISSSAALGQDGTIYFGDENGTFHAVNPDGTVKWTYEVEDIADTNKSILSSPAIDLSGNIYFGSGNGNCYSISDNETNATFNWSFPTSDRVDASPVLGINDEVFFVSRDGYLRSLSTLTGNLNWDAFVGDVFYSSPVVDQNGRAYVIGYTGDGENHLFAFDSDGTIAWDTSDTHCPFEIGGIVDASLALSSDGKLYYGCYDKHIYCIDVGVSPASSDWPMFQRNGRRDGAWPSYLLEASVSPMGVASISGGGIYNEGASATLSVETVNPGYNFSHWSVDATGSDSPLQISVNSNLSVTANFILEQHLLTLNADQGGTVSGSGNFDYGTQTTIVATPNNGYDFTGWSGTGIADPNSAETTVEMNETKTVSASFSLKQYSLSLLVVGEGGSVTGEGNFDHGTQTTIVAIPDDGYVFTGWSGTGISDPYAEETWVEMNETRNISASFSLKQYSLTLLVVGEGGSVTGEGNFSHDSNVTIEAIPDEGYSFTGWIGNGLSDRNNSSTIVHMTQPRTISALFNTKQYLLEINASTGGTVTGEGNYSHGQLVAINAIPASGYQFVEWTGDIDGNVSSPSRTILLDDNKSITALFSEAPEKSFNLSITTDPVNAGSTTGGGNYQSNTAVSISASPLPGYEFSTWQGSDIIDVNSSSTLVNLSQDLLLTAKFRKLSFNLLTNSTVGGSAEGSGSYEYEIDANISAIADEGYSFSGWEGEGIDNPTASVTSVSITKDSNVTAIFSKNIYKLNVFATTGGTVSGEGNFYHGTLASIGAFPLPGYKFEKWEGDQISNQLYRFTSATVNSDLNITALFSHIPMKDELEGVEEIAPDWYDSSWFGAFFQKEGGWSFHFEFGWIFPVIEDEENIWFWNQELGWVWANSEAFSTNFLWVKNIDNWIFWDSSNDSNVRYFDYSDSQWVNWIR